MLPSKARVGDTIYFSFPHANWKGKTITAFEVIVNGTDGANNTLESYSILGLGTIAQKSRATGINLTYIGAGQGDGGDKYVGLDRFGRAVDQNWTNGTVTTDRFQYGYDRNSNALYRNNIVNTNFGELYHVSGAQGLDGLNRQTGFARGVLSSSAPGNPLDTITNPTRTQTWTLDGLGNQSTVTTNGVATNLTFNQQNEISTTPGYSFDPNGNTSADASGNSYLYDAWNRLIQVKNGTNVLATYAYDAEGRRVKEGDIGVTTKDVYFNSNWQILEEDQAGAVKAQYVWSADGQDDLVLRDATGYGFGVQYVQQDGNGNVTAITDSAGNVLERYIFDSYGAVTYLTPGWTAEGASAYGWNFLFEGGRMDAATGLYNFRNRDYSPFLSRWMENDPIGFAGGQNDLYAYEGDNAMSGSDPMGLSDLVDRFTSGLQITWSRAVGIAHGDINPDFVRGLQMIPGRFDSGLEIAQERFVNGAQMIAERANGLAHGNVNPAFVNGLQMVPGKFESGLEIIGERANGLAHGNVNPAFTRGLQIIGNGEAPAAFAEMLGQPVTPAENSIPVWGSFRRAYLAYQKDDALGILTNSMMALGEYMMIRGLLEGAPADNAQPANAVAPTRPTLPAFNGQATEGVLLTNEGQVVPLRSGNPNPTYANYPAAGHVEGQAAIWIRENGSTGGVVYHNNPRGTCGFCNAQVPTLLPEGASLRVVAPEGTVPPPGWFNNPNPYIGNSATPRPNPRLGGS
jgi:RHS repeat-associated protein